MAAFSPLAQRQLIRQLYNAGTQATTWPTSGTGTHWVKTIPTCTTATSTLGNIVTNSLYSTQHLAATDSALVRDTLKLMGEVTIADGEPCEITLPDGTVIAVTKDGSFTINDKDAKVTYRANRVRDFNTFLNASDKLESFIKFCGEAGVKQGEMLDIPVKHFIAWLIVEAARADGEQPSIALPDLRATKPKCVSCGRFMSPKLIAKKVAVCRPICLERQLEAA